VEEIQKKNDVRLKYLDIMRLFAMLAVIMIHVTAYKWSDVSVYSWEWKVFTFFNSAVRFGVPVFVMISGVLFLGKECDIKKLYEKNIKRLAIAYVVWSIFYAVMTNENGNWRIIVIDSIEGYVHLCFLPMIIGLYMLVPLLQRMIATENLTKYYLILSAVFAFVLPQILTLCINLGNELCGDIALAFQNLLEDMHFEYVFGYPFYFIGGYYLNKMKLEKKHRLVIYLLGTCSFLVTFFLTKEISELSNSPIATYLKNFTVNVMLQSVAVFVWVKYNFDKEKKEKITLKIWGILSKYSFGAYLVHMYVVWMINQAFHINPTSFSAIPAVLSVWGITMVVSFLISAILNQIPVLKKYIV